MSTIRLPCHKGLARRTNDPRGNNDSSRSNGGGGVKLRPGQIPYVSHDNGKTRYYADRYYMDAPTALLEHQLYEREKKNDDTKVDYCDYCGEKRQPVSNGAGSSSKSEYARPLFDRAAFINSLDLSCAIIATYTIGDLDFLSETFPALFPYPKSGKGHVPTLVLHGHRGWKLPSERRVDKQTVTGPADWEVEQDEVDCELEPIETISSGAAKRQNDTTCFEPIPVPVKSEPEPVVSVLEEGSDKESAMKRKKDIEKENFNSQSPAKDLPDQIYSCARNKDATKAAQHKPAFTYENQKLDLKSTPRKRKRVKGANNVGFSPRRSPRFSSPKDKKSTPSESPSAGLNLRRSPRLSQEAKKGLVASVKQEEVKRKGSTPLDAIDLGSNTEDDTCNNYPVVIKSGGDVELNRASVKPSSNQLKESKPCVHQTPPSSPNRILSHNQLDPPSHSHIRQTMSDEQTASAPHAPTLSFNPTGKSRKRLKMTPTAPAPSSAASILARSFGSVPDAKLMKPLNYTGDAGDTSDDDSTCGRYILKSEHSSLPTNGKVTKIENGKASGNAKDFSPASVFGGEVFFTQVLPRWIPPKDKMSLKKNKSNNEDDAPEFESVRGCHHPKFFLLFEKSGSLTVIISTCNLTPQHAVDASWVQRFELRSNVQSNEGDVDYGMMHDFGYVLTDFLKKQSEAAEDGMLPDSFLKRYVGTGGLADLPRMYKFEDSHVHLVSTVPGDYSGNLPKRGVASCYNRPPYRHPSITYGPQRVAYILSRVMDKNHISVACATIPRGLGTAGNGGSAAVTPWLPPSLLTKNERLVIQPTSMSGTWTRWELETIAKSYLEPHWKVNNESGYSGPEELLDILWPSMSHFDSMREKRQTLRAKHQAEPCVPSSKKFDKLTRGPCHVFLSSVAFSKLDRVCISRLALFEASNQPYMRCYDTTSLHFKSYCRMLKLTGNTGGAPSQPRRLGNSSASSSQKEHISWFMLTSACLSKGAQGQPTPHRSLDSDSMSYANFELGVLFCSRILGDRVNDRLYVHANDFSGGCQCGAGKRWYKDLLKEEPNKKNKPLAFLDSVRKVHLPIPYQLRPKSYQQDPESDFMSYTPYLHDIPDGTGHVGNMKLTPYGRMVASKNSSPSCCKGTGAT